MIIWVVVIIAVSIAVYMLISAQSKKKQAEINADSLEAQKELTQAQIEAKERCAKNWFCAATQLLGGVGGVVGGVTGVAKKK